MPHLILRCLSCGHVYETVTTTAEGAREARSCPRCGGTPETLPTAGVLHAERDVSSIPALELQEHLEAKRYYESRAEDILSGQLTLKERGPKELRPEVPERLRRTFL